MMFFRLRKMPKMPSVNRHAASPQRDGRPDRAHSGRRLPARGVGVGRIAGEEFVPAVTGRYAFYEAADDAAKFYISPDASASSKRLIPS